MKSFFDCTNRTTATIPNPKGMVQIEPMSASVHPRCFNDRTPPIMERMPGSAKANTLSKF
jgi:hypothetical protein